MIVRKGNVFIKKHCNRDEELKTFYLIERAWCEAMCDVIILIGGRRTCFRRYTPQHVPCPISWNLLRWVQ